MKDTIAKTIKISKSKSITFKDFNFVVAALGKAVGNRNRKRIKNAIRPIDKGRGTFMELRNIGRVSTVNPISHG